MKIQDTNLFKMKRSSAFYIKVAFILLLFPGTFIFQHCSSDRAVSQRIILIGIDGVGISGFQNARTPTLDALARTGALSLKTRAVMPTVSAPNWGSHLLGAGPEQHGITNNGWTTSNHTLEPTSSDENGYFPSVFSIIREQIPGAMTGFFYDWEALADLYNLSYIDKVEFSKGFEETFAKVTPWVIANDPDFTFIYMGHPDGEGHAHQWGSKEYIKAIEDVDAALNQFIKALKEAGLFENTHIIVVSDHGGVNYGHGGVSMEEFETPWIISGPGVISDRVIEQPNDVANTASTIAYLMGLEQPIAWTGSPVYGAFKNHPMSHSNSTAYVPQPVSSLKSGLYSSSEAVTLTIRDPGVSLKYSLNGSDPDLNSPSYKSPILLQKTATLKAASFRDNHRSRITRVDFVRILEVKQIEIQYSADDKYPAQGPTSLIDHEKGSQQYNDGKWLGFKGSNLDAKLVLSERTTVAKVSVGFLNNPGSWIFPPSSIAVFASVDGEKYKEIGRLDKAMIENQIVKGMNSLMVPIIRAQTKYLQVRLENIGICPLGHPGEGQPAWLFVDELIVE